MLVVAATNAGKMMIWAVGAVAGIGLLAGLTSMKVGLVAIASLLIAVTGAALTPTAAWPLWGIINIVILLTILQVSYLVGYGVVCAFAHLRGERQEKQSASEHISAIFLDRWLWPSASRH